MVFSTKASKVLIKEQLLNDVPVYGHKRVIDYLLEHYEPELILEVKRELEADSNYCVVGN